MRRTLLLAALLTTAAQAITIIGTVPQPTAASVTVPSDLSFVPVGGVYHDADISVFDVTFNYTVTAPGATGTGAMLFRTDLVGTSFNEPALFEQMESVARVESPFFLMTQPIFLQGSAPVSCGAILGEIPCTVEFEFNVPQQMHWRIVSAVSYTFLRENDIVQPQLAGSTIIANSDVQLLLVGQFDQAAQMWNVFDNATITISSVPEPSSIILLMAPALLLCWYKRPSFLKARLPAPDQASTLSRCSS